MCHPLGLWKSSLPSIALFHFIKYCFFFSSEIYFCISIWSISFLKHGLFPPSVHWKSFLKKCFSNCCYHLTPYKRGYTVYIMMVCRTTTWTLGKNIRTIVFIWARTFLLPIKQPSSSKCVFSSMFLTFLPHLKLTADQASSCSHVT